MRLLDTGDGEGGEELGVWDPGVPLCHDAAQAGHRPVPGTWGVPGPGEAWLGMWPDPALHRDTSADIGCNLLVTQWVNHNWRMLNPKDLLRHYRLETTGQHTWVGHCSSHFPPSLRKCRSIGPHHPPQSRLRPSWQIPWNWHAAVRVEHFDLSSDKIQFQILLTRFIFFRREMHSDCVL